MNRLLKDLNEAQLRAVEKTEGPLLIIAGAGSGKTRVLTRRLANILFKQLAEPYQVLAMTFTNKAAGEMNERVNSLLGGYVPGLNVSTFHSFCSKFLRMEADKLGYDSNFTIFDTDDSLTLIKNCIKELKLSGSQFTPKAQFRKISNAKNKMIDFKTFESSANGYFETTTAEIYRIYQTRLLECNGMDFDDLLVNAVTLVKFHDEVGNRYRNRFKYIMVDEYQDTNHVQYLLLKYLLDQHNNICVVGDEDQAIYGWRGADIRNILEFEKDFPGAELIKLEQNYRSTNLILKAAGAVIKNNEARKGKNLWTDKDGGDKIQLLLVDNAEDEAARVIESIIDKEKSKSELKNIALLYRTNAQSRPFEEEFRRQNIPYQIFGGISFYQRREIKDIMAYLKLIVNSKDDISFQRIINVPKRGIGNKTVSDLANIARRQSLSFYEIAQSISDYNELSHRFKKILSFVELIEKFKTNQETQPIDLLVGELIDDLKLFESYRDEDEIQGQTRIENVEAFIEGMAAYARKNSNATLAEYLAEISLFTDMDKDNNTDEKVSLMTIHSAKGLEYNVIYMLGLEEGLFPLGNAMHDPMGLEEERRLFYVGATRARERLYLSSATSRYRFGEVESMPSRFIKEISPDLIERKDLRTRRHYEYGSRPQQSLFNNQRLEPKPEPKGVHYDYEEEEIMRVGRIVSHPTFGRGKIVNVEGFGESIRLEIMFSGIGIKKIMAKFAKLKIIG